MNNSVWSLMTTRDGLSAQLTAPRFESYPAEDLGAAPVERVATESRRFAPLFRRLRTATATA
jgi:hypothetical protein